MASFSVLLFWSLIVWGSSSRFSTATQMASSVSCFTLLKPTKGMDLGSQSSWMFAWGWAVKSSPSCFRKLMMTAWSLWGEPSKALLMANFEGRNTNMLHWGSTWVEDRKSASTSSAGERVWMAVSFVVTVSPSTLSMCFHSQP